MGESSTGRTVRSVGVAAFAVLAVSLAAAALDSTATPGRRDPSAPAGSGGGTTGGLLPLPRSGTVPGKSVTAPLPTELFVGLALLAVLVIAAYLLVHRRATVGALAALVGLLGLSTFVSPAVDPLAAVLVVFGALATVAYAAVYRRALLRGVLLSVAAILALVVLAGFLPPASRATGSSVFDPVPGTVFGGRGGGETVASQVTPPTLLVLAVLGLGLVGAVVVLRRSAGDEEEPDTGGEDDGVERATAVGRAAGRAAERIEAEPDAANGVYRAWREMTTLLEGPDPATSTPGEFAEAAVAAGLGREDVAELTRLFEDVRYGETTPTDAHERRAVAVLRRIETRYATADHHDTTETDA